MEKRVFIAVLLSFVILAVYQAYFAPPPPKTTTSAPAPSVTRPATDVTPSGSASSPSPAAMPAPVPAAATVVGDARARDIVVETDDVLAVFSTQGAVLKSWKLKNYLAAPDSQGNSGLLDLVPSDVAGDKPFTLKTDDAATSAILAQALYRPSVDHLSLGSASGTLNFEYQDRSGLDAHKTFHFRPDGKRYVIGLTATVDVAGKTQPITVSWGPGLGLGYVPDGSREAQPAAGILWRNDKVERP
ncbi:MAG TPA: membrane protein insertase YidC, partial [Vicinamibacterales bacterium]